MDRLTRRAALAAPALLLAHGALAQANSPGRPVTVIVPWAPGGSNDVTARLLTPHLEGRFGQPFIVENRPGGGGSVGMGEIGGAGQAGWADPAGFLRLQRRVPRDRGHLAVTCGRRCRASPCWSMCRMWWRRPTASA